MPEQEFYWSPVPASPIKHPCPCCGYQTLREPPPGTWQTCPVCQWEDEPGMLADFDYVGGRPVSASGGRGGTSAVTEPLTSAAADTYAFHVRTNKQGCAPTTTRYARAPHAIAVSSETDPLDPPIRLLVRRPSEWAKEASRAGARGKLLHVETGRVSDTFPSADKGSLAVHRVWPRDAGHATAAYISAIRADPPRLRR
jgi:hypothetical protein